MNHICSVLRLFNPLCICLFCLFLCSFPSQERTAKITERIRILQGHDSGHTDKRKEGWRECGYDFVEISIDETDEKLARLEWTTEERLDLVKAMKDTRVPIRSMCLSGHRKYPFGASDPKVRRRGMDIMEKAILLADDLGIRIIQLAGYDVYYEKGTADSERLFCENLKKATMMAAAGGIVLGFETMETEY